MMPFDMPNMNPQQLIQQAIQNNPQLADNPQAQQYIQVLMSNDAQLGQELAQNICKTYHVSPKQGVQQAQQFFQQNSNLFRGG